MTDKDQDKSFFKRLFGKPEAQNDKAEPKKFDPKNLPEVPPQMEALLRSLMGDVAKNAASFNTDDDDLPDDMPPELKAIIQGLRSAGAHVKAVRMDSEGNLDFGSLGGDHDCDCAPGHPMCAKTTLPQLIEWVKKFNVRVIHDPEDPEMNYIAEEDVKLALLAACRVGELAARAAGTDDQDISFASAVAAGIVSNTGSILTNPDLQIDLGKQEVPDTIPTDWKLDG